MPADLPHVFRTLASFSPARLNFKDAPWQEYVDWAVGQGLASLAAYNLEYRMGGAGAPAWVRDRLLSLYQGAVNDNVSKLVNFKRTVDDLQGRQVVLLSGAAFAETLYPHVGFRPILDIRLLTHEADVEGFANFLRHNQFQPEPQLDGAEGAARVVSDGTTQILLFTSLTDDASAKGQVEKDLFARALPAKVYGPSFFRPDLEDAILAVCLEHARAGYDVPMLSFIDLRELLTGAKSVVGPYSKPFNPAALHERADKWGASRALYASASIVGRLFPETAEDVAKALPALSAPARLALDTAVVGPLSEPGRQRELKVAEKVRRALTALD